MTADQRLAGPGLGGKAERFRAGSLTTSDSSSQWKAVPRSESGRPRTTQDSADNTVALRAIRFRRPERLHSITRTFFLSLLAVRTNRQCGYPRQYYDCDDATRRA